MIAWALALTRPAVTNRLRRAVEHHYFGEIADLARRHRRR